MSETDVFEADDFDFIYYYEKHLENNIPLFSGEGFAEDNLLTNAQGDSLSLEYSYLPTENNPLRRVVIPDTTDGDLSIYESYELRNAETGEPTRKEFMIRLKDDAPIKNSFVDDMEDTVPYPTCYDLLDSNGDTVIYCSSTPNRSVSPAGSKYISTTNLYKYYLTDAEAETLKNDFRVQSVEIPPEQDGCDMVTDAYQSGNFSRAAAGFNDPNNIFTVVLQPFGGDGYWNGIDFIPGEEVIQVLNSGTSNINYANATARATILTWSDGRLYNIYGQGGWYIWPILNIVNITGNLVPSEGSSSQQYIKGVTSGAVWKIGNYGIGKFLQQDSNWGLTRCNALGNSQDPVPSRYDYVLDGTGVDVVIMDTGIYPDHPEFQDADGNSRVVQHNWYVAAGRPAEASKQNSMWFYTDQSGHGTHVAGTVAGKTFGWAKNAKIYSMKILGGIGKIPYDEAFDLIAAWHNSKPIETETGTKRPTIVNCSWSWRRTLGYGPPMIYGGRWNEGTQNKPPSVWNTDNTSTPITEIRIRGTTYNKNNLPNSGNSVDVGRFDTFNTGTKTYNATLYSPSWGETFHELDKFWKVFASPFHYYEAYTLGVDNQNRHLLFSRPSVNANIDFVDGGIQMMIDAGIHVCVAAGNNNDWIVSPSDENYNNYATFVTYPNIGGFAEQTTNGWELGPTTGYSTSITSTIYFQRKTSPYATDAIIVGSMNAATRKQGDWIYTMTWNTDVKDTTPAGDETRSYFSNFGSGVDIYAPGSDIISCTPNYMGKTNGINSDKNSTTFKVQPYYYNNSYSQAKISGTSMASPQVCGFGALLLQVYPELTPYELKYLIKGISNKTTGLLEVRGYTSSKDKWGRTVNFCPYTSSIYTLCSTSSEQSILFNIEGQKGKQYYGLGGVATVNILYNPYSETLPTNTDIVIRRILAADNTLQLVSVTNIYTAIRVTWNEIPAEDLVGYIIERSLFPDRNFVALNSTPVTGRFYDDSSAEINTTYYYRVYAIGENSTQSTRSSVLSGTRIPIRSILVVNTPVTDLTAEARRSEVILNWTETTAQDHVHYDVYRSVLQTSGYAKINSSAITTTSYTDTNITTGIQYYYKVISVNINGQTSPDSNIVSVLIPNRIITPPIQTPVPPSGGNVPVVPPSTEVSTEVTTEPKNDVIIPWVSKGGTIKTVAAKFTSPGQGGTEAGTEEGTDSDAGGLRMSNTTWCETVISTQGMISNGRLEFAFRTNGYSLNEFLGVFYYDGLDWKMAFAGRGEDYKLVDVPLENNALNKSEVKIRFHAFTTFKADNKWCDFDAVTIYGNESI